MTIIIFSYPQLILALHKDEKVRSLESLTSESGIPNINVMVMDDYKKDSRINLIKIYDRQKRERWICILF